MTSAFDPALQRGLDALGLPGLLIGHRVIAAGDEDALRDAEVSSLPSRVPAARRASGAVRIVARALLAQLGHPDAQVPKGATGQPIWPAGVVGSLAHDDEVAVAAVGLRRDFASIGIDVEPSSALPSGMLALIATPREHRVVDGDLVRARLLFAAKEAVYKAVYPVDALFLEFSDIEVDLAAGKADTRSGRTLSLRTCVSPRIVVVAVIGAAQA